MEANPENFKFAALQEMPEIERPVSVEPNEHIEADEQELGSYPLGYFGWWWNFCLPKKRCFPAAQVRFFDRLVFPAAAPLRSARPPSPSGMSLLAVAAAKKTSTDSSPGRQAKLAASHE